MKTAYIINGSRDYRELFESFGFTIVDNMGGATLVVFTGGADVSPYLYGDEKHAATFSDKHRDIHEQALFKAAKDMGVPMVGICRGGQFLNVMNGGRMYQHVDKHACYDGHMLEDVESGREVFVSSTHHQMFMPADDSVIVATAKLGGFREWYDGHHFKRDESNTDYEVLFYPKSKSLCFQPHPEFRGEKYVDMREYFRSLLEKYLGV